MTFREMTIGFVAFTIGVVTSFLFANYAFEARCAKLGIDSAKQGIEILQQLKP